jgi:hypothetical protein
MYVALCIPTGFIRSKIKYNMALNCLVDCVWNVMAHAQEPDFVFRRNGRVHLNQWGRQFSRLLAAEVCASAVVMLDTPCFGVVWRVLATHCIRQFPLYFPCRASPCAITFQLDSTDLFLRLGEAPAFLSPNQSSFVSHELWYIYEGILPKMETIKLFQTFAAFIYFNFLTHLVIPKI